MVPPPPNLKVAPWSLCTSALWPLLEVSILVKHAAADIDSEIDFIIEKQLLFYTVSIIIPRSGGE